MPATTDPLGALRERLLPPPPFRLPLAGETDSVYWANRRAWPPAANTLRPVPLRKLLEEVSSA